MKCFVGDNLEDLKLAVFADASFAGDLKDSKSTSGGFLCLVGPKTYVPLTWVCKKQGAVSHSSTEAEVISLEALMRLEGIPALNLWNQVLEVFCPRRVVRPADSDMLIAQAAILKRYHAITLDGVDFVPPAMPYIKNAARLYMVIKMAAPLFLSIAVAHIVLIWTSYSNS